MARALVLGVALVLVAFGGTPAIALATSAARPASAADPVPEHASGPTGPTGPTGPGASTTATATAGGPPGPSGVTPSTADQQSAITSGGDPLVANGLGSVICTTPQLESQLSPQELADCQTSSFVAAAAPTGNYAFDIHIDTGLIPGANTIALLFQEFVLTPVWLAFVWIIHSLIVALEWCYTLDLLQGPTLASVTGALHQAQATVTQPWLAAVLSVAALLALYQGVVRRRVAATVGEAALAVVMMAGGLWVVFNPAGTVGAVAAWSNEASLGALATVSQGSPSQPAGAFAADMQDLFGASVQGPWCYLEFGDVEWCRDPAQVNPQLRSAAQVIASVDQDNSDPAYRESATLLRRAQSNGDFFLALPANTEQRNAIGDNSMFLALCRSISDTDCQGAMVAQAEFRTASGTWPRAGGLLLIAIGMVGLIAMLAFIALRLLGAAVASLLLLLLAPLAVLAPALGYSGRNAFRAWGVRLLGAFSAKLLYSVLLGVVLLVLRILTGLTSVGWWVQWLLISTLWWSVFHHRHRILHYASASQIESSPQASRILESVRRRSRVTHGGVLRVPRRLPHLPPPDPKGQDRPGPRGPRTGDHGGGRWRRKPKPVDPTRMAPPDRDTTVGAPLEPGPRPHGDVSSGPRSASMRDRTRRLGDRVRDIAARRDAGRPDVMAHRAVAHERLRSGDPGPIRAGLEADRARLARITHEVRTPAAHGQPRRRASLERRAQLVTEQIGASEQRLRTAESAGLLATDPVVARRRRRDWAKLLDRQGQAPRTLDRTAPGPRRAYAALAPIVGLDRSAYEQLAPNVEIRKRLAIDRALELRKREAKMARRLKRGERAERAERAARAAASARLDVGVPGERAAPAGGGGSRGSTATPGGTSDGHAPAGHDSGPGAGAKHGESASGPGRPRDDSGHATRGPRVRSTSGAERASGSAPVRPRRAAADPDSDPEASGRRRGDDAHSRARAPDGTPGESTAMRRERQFMRELEARRDKLPSPPPPPPPPPPPQPRRRNSA